MNIPPPEVCNHNPRVRKNVFLAFTFFLLASFGRLFVITAGITAALSNWKKNLNRDTIFKTNDTEKEEDHIRKSVDNVVQKNSTTEDVKKEVAGDIAKEKDFCLTVKKEAVNDLDELEADLLTVRKKVDSDLAESENDLVIVKNEVESEVDLVTVKKVDSDLPESKVDLETVRKEVNSDIIEKAESQRNVTDLKSTSGPCRTKSKIMKKKKVPLERKTEDIKNGPLAPSHEILSIPKKIKRNRANKKTVANTIRESVHSCKEVESKEDNASEEKKGKIKGKKPLRIQFRQNNTIVKEEVENDGKERNRKQLKDNVAEGERKDGTFDEWSSSSEESPTDWLNKEEKESAEIKISSYSKREMFLKTEKQKQEDSLKAAKKHREPMGLGRRGMSMTI